MDSIDPKQVGTTGGVQQYQHVQVTSMPPPPLTFAQKIELIHLAQDLRAAPPIGIVGAIELRSLVADLFPEFERVRDDDIDQVFKDMAEEQASQYDRLAGVEDSDD